MIDADSRSTPSNSSNTNLHLSCLQHLELLTHFGLWVSWILSMQLWAEKLPRCLLPEITKPRWDQAITDSFVKASFSAEPVTASIAFNFIRADLSNTTSGLWHCIHVNELWLRFEVETHTHLLTKDQRQDHKPTFWVLVWHTAEICCGQTRLRTTWRVIGLIFQFHSDYAVGFPPVAIVGH